MLSYTVRYEFADKEEYKKFHTTNKDIFLSDDESLKTRISAAACYDLFDQISKIEKTIENSTSEEADQIQEILNAI